MASSPFPVPTINFAFSIEAAHPRIHFFGGGIFFLAFFAGKKSELGVNPILGLGVEEKR